MSDTTNTSHAVGDKPKLIFACSGGSDVGGLADQSGRALTRDGVGKMYCLAGLGARIQSFIDTTNAADSVIAIDGCQQDCARKTLEGCGITKFPHVRLSDLGLKKGSSPATPENISIVKTAAINASPALKN